MSQVHQSVQDAIAILEIDNPPVNALSQAIRQGLAEGLEAACNDPSVKAILIVGRGRTFIAGADIREFGKPPQEPFLPDLCNRIEESEKPVITALHGTALGGGLEVALATHYRVALKTARFGLPEVKLGLLPGAGGTQRLPRLVPAEMALEMITTGADIGAGQAHALGLVDQLSDANDPAEAGLSYARNLIATGAAPRPTRANTPLPADTALFKTARARLAKKACGQYAPQTCVDAVEAAYTLPFDEGLARERVLFLELMGSDQRAALIHAFFAERKVAKLPEIEGIAPRDVTRVGVIGGGTMGSGIAVSCLLAGLEVTMIERDQDGADRAHGSVVKTLQGAVKRGKLSEDGLSRMIAKAFRASVDYNDLADTDLIIEAVFESLDVKRGVFEELDAVCKPGAILASNTSYLDLNAIAAMTKRPKDVIGLHFFSPAHVMRLLEVVVGDKTAPEVVATGFALAKRLKKVAVRAGVCDGFIGNRILAHCRKALEGAVLAGASPFDIDRALVDFGLAMGPFAVMDLAGLDIAWANRKRLAPTRDPRESYTEFADVLCEAGHFGRKTGRGFYIYDADGQRPNPEVAEIINEERARKGIAPHPLSDQQIVDRYMAAMINEAARVVEEGIALRPLDVDVTLLNGYGFPRWRGGPMYYADVAGLQQILAHIREFAAEDSFLWQPAPLIERFCAEDKPLAALNS